MFTYRKLKPFWPDIGWLKFNQYLICMASGKSVNCVLLIIQAFSGRFSDFLSALDASSLCQLGMYLIRLISRAWIFSA
ncbi:hypothetical protein D6K27_25165, partial [Salmonella enterica subsp. enterica]|nr:hypothetical protein [Salmonella enterica subsp. enterica serovar Bonariensis]